MYSTDPEDVSEYPDLKLKGNSETQIILSSLHRRQADRIGE